MLLYRHLDQSLTSSSSLTALPKPRTVHDSSNEPITGLGFKEPSQDNANQCLFIITTNRILQCPVTGRGSGGSSTALDDIGCGLGCATMDWRAKDMVIARDEAIYICTTEGRGACFAYEGTNLFHYSILSLTYMLFLGHKSSVHIHLNYVVIVSPPFIPAAVGTSATVRNFVARSANANSGESDVTKVTVFDLENTLVAYSGIFAEGVREIISQWGQVYVLSNDGKVRHPILEYIFMQRLFSLSYHGSKKSPTRKSWTCFIGEDSIK